MKEKIETFFAGLLGTIIILCIMHNLLFRVGFFGGSTYGYYNNEYVRVFKIRDQKALISKSSNKGIIYSKKENEKWINVRNINFE